MKDCLIDLFEYHHYYNQKLVDFLLEHNELADVQINHWFSHMVNAHQIWNARVLQTKTLAVHQKRNLVENKPLDLTNFIDSKSILESFSLKNIIHYQNSKGAFGQPLHVILFHIINHHTHHRAQIISKIRQNGITPPVTDYIHYKRMQSTNDL